MGFSRGRVHKKTIAVTEQSLLTFILASFDSYIINISRFSWTRQTYYLYSLTTFFLLSTNYTVGQSSQRVFHCMAE